MNFWKQAVDAFSPFETPGDSETAPDSDDELNDNDNDNDNDDDELDAEYGDVDDEYGDDGELFNAASGTTRKPIQRVAQ